MKNRNIFIKINSKKVDIIEGHSYKNKEYYIFCNTELYDLNNKLIPLKKIITYYEDNIELANIISDQFSIIIYNIKENTLFFSQDINGDSVPIYYHINNNEIIISNRLVNITTIKQFKINKDIVSTFIKKGFIPNKNTLVDGVFKIVPKSNLLIDLKSKKEQTQKKKLIYKKIKDKNNALYIKDFEKIVKDNEKNKKILTTLSSGYDSNFIFKFLTKDNLKAFTVGGVVGTDETKIVKYNLQKYSNVNLTTAYVSEKTLDRYPELVYELEGLLYERGIFLQYVLVNKLKENNSESTVLYAGVGADQIFSYEYYKKYYSLYNIIKYIGKLLKKSLLIDELNNIKTKGGIMHNKHAFDFISYIIIKKNGILLNKYGIEYCYPFLNRNIINYGYSNRYKNIFSKKSHIQACQKIIDKDVLKNVHKIGGSTDQNALFGKCTYINEIEKLVNKSKYNILKIKDTKNHLQYYEYLLKVIYVELFEYLFIENYSTVYEKSQIDLLDFILEKNNEYYKEPEYSNSVSDLEKPLDYS